VREVAERLVLDLAILAERAAKQMRRVSLTLVLAPERAPNGALLEEAEARFYDVDPIEIGRVPVSRYRLRLAEASEEATFRRGDFDASGALDLTDAIAVLGFLFSRGAAPSCLAAADADGDDVLGLSDAVRTLAYLFRGGAPLPEPFTSCGPSGGADGLGCESFAGCP